MRRYPKSTLHCMLITQPSPEINVKIFAKPQPFQSDQYFVKMLPFRHKIQPKFSSSFLCCTLPTVHYPSSYFLHFSVFFLANSLPLPEGQAVTACESSEQLTFLTPPFNTELFISPSGISELDCATTKTDTAERSISISRESLQVSFVLGALAYFQVPPLGGSREEKWRSQ